MKTTRALIGLAGLVLAFIVGACAPKGEGPQPPAMAYGQDLCEACGMLIDQPQLAAASLDTQGQTHKFDEVGDMIQFHAEHPTLQVQAWFVHDYDNEAWIRGETAFFVYRPDQQTPMGHGLVAFETEAGALAFAQQWDTQVLSFDEARAAMHAMDHAGH